MHYATVVLAILLSPLQAREPILDLADRNCGNEVLIANIEGAELFASCASAGKERVMRLSVVNQASDKEGPRRDFSLGFCGPSIIQASGPRVWVAKIERDPQHSVTWSLPDDAVERLGIRSSGRLSGFAIRLRPGWTMSRS